MGRSKKYNAKSLQAAIDDYFAAISYTTTAKEMVDSGKRDEKGHVILHPIEIKNDRGEPIAVREFVRPPTVTGLCRSLGISRETWREYSDDEKLGPIAEAGKAVIEEYLETMLYREKNVTGIIFNLQNNYGWKEKKEVDGKQRVTFTLSEEAEEYGQ